MLGNPPNRNRALDGLRGVAILWVIGYHLFGCPPVHPAIEAVPGLGPLLSFGWLGVVIFFVLSGYLITSQLVQARGRPGYWRHFLVKRAARILPAYALLLLSLPVAAAVWPADRAGIVFNDQVPWASHFMLVQNFFMTGSGYLGNEWLRPTWSLAVEVQYYVFIALFVALCPPRLLRPGLALLALGAVVIRFWMAAYLANPEASMMVLAVARMDSFALGGLVALLPAGAWSRRRAAAWAGIAGAGGALFVLYALGGFGSFTHAMQPVYYTFVSVAVAALAGLLGRGTWPSSWLGGSWLVAAGRYSYFLYLFHMPLVWICHEWLHQAAPRADTNAGLLTSAASVAVTWLLAWAAWRWMEAPAIAAGHRWATGGKGAATSGGRDAPGTAD
ncbi:acyltransferase [Opitutus sp. GAS368]|uniref:acyltransferase family protein n=1 Tax=Opitutus sp. GAS368 TaxID=1882749 RepID=UPI00087B5030|nr:acyltransferase [Opitutus sp. GAS368]SDS06376.1 Peptidoglycan/LPS O-acetylase OafA/YrhL, contains acyltransferase and SGNH-hydrolase domains [Opitutus sp. GAS368]